jgi:hypothetical protein
MPKTPFVWKADDAFNTAFSAQVANATYHVASQNYGHPAYVEVRNRRGDLKTLDRGYYVKIEQAKQACERHYAAGCKLSRAEKIIQ